MSSQEIEVKLKQLQREIENLTTFFSQNIDFSVKVNTSWSAKDVLGHLTFWHESFARNVSDLANGIKPTPLKGKLSEVNALSVESTQSSSINELVNRIKKAQQKIVKYILNKNIEMIPYKKGSRDYSPTEHLEIVTNHIKKHLTAMQKVFKQYKLDNPL